MPRKYLPFLSFAIILALASGQGCPTDTGSNNNNQDTTGDQAGTGDNGGTDTGETGNTDGSDDGDTPVASTVQVDIDGFAFEPKSITIHVGQTVKWTNREFTPHRVHSGDPEDEDKGELFRSESLGMNKSFTHTFDVPGTYEYHCEYYYNRQDLRDATVIVTE
jgi:plastocyanin